MLRNPPERKARKRYRQFYKRKMKRILTIFILHFFILTTCYAQFPNITGIVKLSIQNGTIECDLEISNLPKIKNYSLWLNTGLNVRYFRDSTDKSNYDYDKYYKSERSAEAFQYFITKKDSVFLPHKLKLNYIGAFPVIADTLRMSNRGDWKGNMAFNGKTIRASEQTAWYPILYDTLNDFIYNKVTYDLTVICNDCKSIYINGSAPQSSTKSIFKSSVPVPLLLFAGNFDFNKENKTYFVNSNLQLKQQSQLSGWTNKIIKFYETNLKIPYGSDITYLGTTPVSKRNNWAFVTYPTIAVIGNQWSLKDFFGEKTYEIKDSSTIKYIAHELGHYYFGTYFVPNAELHWVFLEGVTDYISLLAIREILGETLYKQNLSEYIAQIKDYKVTPLTDIKKSGEVDEMYKYIYIPLLLTALEKEIGKDKIWSWLHIILTSKNVNRTNYAFLKSTLLESGLTEKEFTNFENIYIKGANAKQKVIEKVE